LLGCCTSSAGANPVRLHGTAAAARATGEYQKDEFGWGVGALGAVELGLSAELGLELELGGLWLSEGDDPVDPAIEPQADGAAGIAALGLRVRPFARSYAGRAASAAGLWLAANGGLARTEDLTRPMFDAQLGYDFLFSKGRVGVGPMLGYMHVFQPDDEIRPQDANIALAGLHVMFDTAGAAAVADGDKDRDGIPDAIDRCPDVPEDKDDFEDEDGCPEADNDKDGIQDGKDNCPLEPEDKDGFQDEDGCPDPDNDRDGIPDVKDKCPNDPEDKDGFEDEDGCPEVDNDKDGIADVQDLCPNEPETVNNYADQDGCPDEQQVRVLGDKIVLDDRVHFRTNNAQIRHISYPLLERLAKLIKDHPEYVHVDIEGHADERGTEAYNQKLSEARANSVLEFLVKKGIERSRLSARGYGTTRPLVEKRSEYAWLLNRRVEFLVTRQAKYTGATPPTLPTPDPKESKKVSDLPAAADEENVPAPEDEGDPERKGGPDSKPERPLKPEPKAEPKKAPAPAPKPAPKPGSPGGSP
jgi:outer membrane protein OmpA-like peptidoglycan-associated protein